MPNPTARSVSHVGTVGSPLSDDDRAKLLDLLTRSKCATNSDSAAQFVGSMNMSIVFAYKLDPLISTRGERREWFKKVRRAIDPLLTVLAEADSHRDEGNPEVYMGISDDLSLLDSELLSYFEGEYTLSASSATVAVLKRLASKCDEQIKKFGRGTKDPRSRQRLADDLAEFWLRHMAKKPTASLSEDRSGSLRRSPFIETLGVAISAADRYYDTALDPPSDDGLRGLASRAVKKL